MCFLFKSRTFWPRCLFIWTDSWRFCMNSFGQRWQWNSWKDVESLCSQKLSWNLYASMLSLMVISGTVLSKPAMCKSQTTLQRPNINMFHESPFITTFSAFIWLLSSVQGEVNLVWRTICVTLTTVLTSELQAACMLRSLVVQHGWLGDILCITEVTLVIILSSVHLHVCFQTILTLKSFSTFYANKVFHIWMFLHVISQSGSRCTIFIAFFAHNLWRIRDRVHSSISFEWCYVSLGMCLSKVFIQIVSSGELLFTMSAIKYLWLTRTFWRHFTLFYQPSFSIIGRRTIRIWKSIQYIYFLLART